MNVAGPVDGRLDPKPSEDACCRWGDQTPGLYGHWESCPHHPRYAGRVGRCEWCHGADEDPASDKVETRGDWWHRECAADCLAELEEALSEDKE